MCQAGKTPATASWQVYRFFDQSGENRTQRFIAPMLPLPPAAR
jgi:hypothetical protein